VHPDIHVLANKRPRWFVLVQSEFAPSISTLTKTLKSHAGNELDDAMVSRIPFLRRMMASLRSQIM
jgi:hypothetical protein